MTVATAVLAGLFVALIISLVVLFWQYILAGAGVLLFVLWYVGQANNPSPALNPEEQEQRRRNFLNYQIAQDTAERREVYHEAQVQWWQQQQPPPRDPSTWGGGDGGHSC